MLTNLIVWILVGAFAGWLAGRVVRRHDFDFVRSIIVGLIGALFGGWLFGQLGIHLGAGLVGEIVVASSVSSHGPAPSLYPLSEEESINPPISAQLRPKHA